MERGRPRLPSTAACMVLCCLVQPQACTLATPEAPRTSPPEATCPHVPKPQDAKTPAAAADAASQILQPGHWEWNDGDYAWSAPSWRPRAEVTGTRWLNGYWETNGGACVWHNGRFVTAPAPAKTPAEVPAGNVPPEAHPSPPPSSTVPQKPPP